MASPPVQNRSVLTRWFSRDTHRRSTILLLLCFLLPVAEAIGQVRYLEPLFDKAKTQTLTFASAPGGPLQMDVFTPYADEAVNRPVMLYVHGGGFAGGARDEDRYVKFCSKMAQHGFVAITMSYSLTMKGQSFGCDQAAVNKIRTFKSAAYEIAQATSFIIKNSEKLGIDSSKIVLIGSSAGAEAVLHAAYWKESWSEVLPHSFRFAGVISLAGAISNIELITPMSAIPTQLFHGTCDNLVPYGTAAHHYCEFDKPGYLLLHGAYPIAKRLELMGKGYYLVTGCFGKHEWNDKPLFEYVKEITDFVHSDVLQSTKRQIHLIVPSGENTCEDYNAFAFCKE